jgi:hypothetical protein
MDLVGIADRDSVYDLDVERYAMRLLTNAELRHQSSRQLLCRLRYSV